MAYRARIVLDSVSPLGVRLTTFEITFQRFILAELNTHRDFSRNSASSRAIPIEKMLTQVMNDPATPVFWGVNQSGMQAAVEVGDVAAAKKAWLLARDAAVASVPALRAVGERHEELHKQIVNRVLEPYLWHTVIVTATNFRNFFRLRCHPDAQPEIQHIAHMMRDLFESSTPKALAYGEWHLPYIQDDERHLALGVLKQVSAGRCARVSYLTHDGKRELAKDIELFERLVAGSGDQGHWSPLEHCCTPALPLHRWLLANTLAAGARLIGRKILVGPLYRRSNVRCWNQYRKYFAGERADESTPLQAA